MGARSYDDEEYLPWYRQPTPTWLELSAAARGVLVSVAMTLNHRTGEVHLRKGLPSLATLLRLPWSDLEPALTELLDAGKLEWDDARAVLRDPEFMGRSRRGRTSKERTRDWRARKASVTDVTPGDGCDVTSVTRVTPVTVTAVTQIDQIRSDQIPPTPQRGTPEPRAAVGTALSVEATEAYQDAVSKQTGTPYKLARFEDRDLCVAINAHCPDADNVLVWLRTMVPRWIQENRGRAGFTGGWAPKHFAAWLRTGPTSAANGGASARSRRELT